MVGLVARQADRHHRAPPGWSPGSPAPQLDEDLGWPDVLGLSLLGGIGFTVSLLISELAFGAGSERYDHAKVGVLAGTVLAAAAGRPSMLRLRNRRYRRIAEEEQVDVDADGVPDVYQAGGDVQSGHPARNGEERTGARKPPFAES